MRNTLRFFKPYLPYILAICVVLFGQAMCELALPGYMSDIVNKGIVGQDTDYIFKTGALMVLVSFFGVSCAILGNFFSTRTASFSTRDMRQAVFKRVSSFSDAEMGKFSIASLITRSTNDIQMIQQATIMLLRFAVYSPIMAIGALIKALSTCKSLTWTIGIALVVLLGVLMLVFVLVMPKFKVLQSKLDKLNLIVGERLSGLLVVRAFNAEPKEEKRYDDANVDLTKINIFVNRSMAFLMPAMTLIMNGVSILIVWVGAHLMETSNLLIGDMLAYLQYAIQVIMSFLFISMIFIMVPRAVVSAGRIGEVVEVEPGITDKEDAKTVGNAKGVVEFKNVSFAYNDSGDYALKNISFAAKPGETTAIIGGTGSGKSSLVNLIPRLYDVTEGQVLLDGTDIRKIKQEDLRENIGFVPQKGILFSGSVADNLRYGKEDATQEEMEEAASIAQAKGFIEEMPEKYETFIAQGGTSVSGGQKQRLAIARALIKKPKIYVFDDSFSALDFKTDRALRTALRQEVGGSTFIIVAQRINTIMDADSIVVLDEGEIVGKGTHEELLKTCEVYREIASSQLSEKELRREAHA